MIARVFPRRTAASPTDALAFYDVPPMLGLPEIAEIHVSVAFSWDMSRAEWLAHQWGAVGVPVSMGGPAFNAPGGDFVAGRYLREGYVITSRGCPNRCQYAPGQKCMVPEREGGTLRELPIVDGWNVLDDNLLACSKNHIVNVFAMLARQTDAPVFTGGLEAKLLRPWHIALLRSVKTRRMYFAYDTPDDFEPLVDAGKILRGGGFSEIGHTCGCYVLIGYRDDTFGAAEKRLCQTVAAGFMPYAMLYRDERGATNPDWKAFQREWLRPEIVGTKMRQRMAVST